MVSQGRVASDKETVLESNNVVPWLHIGDPLANRLDDTGAFVPQNDRESSFGVLSGERIGI